MCKAINESGIFWPETAAGEHVERECPKGMTGKSTQVVTMVNRESLHIINMVFYFFYINTFIFIPK